MSDETPHRFLRYSYGEEELFCFLFDSRHIIILLQSARTHQGCEVRLARTDGKSVMENLIEISSLLPRFRTESVVRDLQAGTCEFS